MKTSADFAKGAVFLDLETLDRGDLDLNPLEMAAAPLQAFARTSAEELDNRALEAWCVITNKVELDARFFRGRPDLRLVCITATGTNNVDLEAAAAHGVTVVNCRGYSTEAVAQHVIMLVLLLLRNFPQYHSEVRSGAWSQSPQFCLLGHGIRETAGLRLGIVGYGAIGQEVERLAQALGMDTLLAERPGQTPRPGRLALEEVLRNCDVVSLHCPLTADTAGIINEKTLQLMKPGAFLINTARGGLVHEPALAAALVNGDIAGAAVDVLDVEPPPADNPLLKAETPNLIITPHNAWASLQARQRAVKQTAENIHAWKKGQDLRVV